MVHTNLLADKKTDWDIINSYFNDIRYYFTKSQLDSYNYFVTNRINYTIRVLNENRKFEIIKNYKDTEIEKYHIRIYVGGKNSDEIFLSKPIIYNKGAATPLYPNEARLKDYNYVSRLSANVYIYYTHLDKSGEVKWEKEVKYESVDIGDIPIMLHSKLCVLHDKPAEVLREMGECPYDHGGYFIIDGKEKVVIAQERIATNTFFIEEVDDKKQGEKFKTVGLIRCTSADNALFPKATRFFVYRNDQGVKSQSIVLTIPNIGSEQAPVPVPLFYAFRLLGIESDADIIRYIVGDRDSMTNKRVVEFLRPSIVAASHLYTQSQVFEYYKGNTKYGTVDHLKVILVDDFLPNITGTFINKAYYLGYLANMLIKTELGILLPTEKDNYLFKRVDLSGYLLTNLFVKFYNILRRNIMNKIDREYNMNIDNFENTGKSVSELITDKFLRESLFRPENATTGRDESISTAMIKSLKGDWALEAREDPRKAGVSQDVSRFSYMSYVSHVRRINTPLDRSIKIAGPHKLRGTHFGAMCPIESPDGASIGLMKHFPVLTQVTYDIEDREIRIACRDFGMLDLLEVSPEITGHPDIGRVFINNSFVGVHHNLDKLYTIIKLLKRHSILNYMISVSWYVQKNTLNILSDAGRIIRPLYVVDNTMDYKIKRGDRLYNRLLIDEFVKDNKGANWNDYTRSKLLGKKFDEYSSIYHRDVLIREGLIVKKGAIYEMNDNNIERLRDTAPPIEYVDIDECNCGLIAPNRSYLANRHYKYTHCEIDMSTILSMYSNIIPLSHNNPYPRNVFGTSQGKQAIGVYATNFNNRIDTACYVLHYPQKALVHTRYSKYAHIDELPNGENLIVAIMTFTGYNQEDSIIINRKSIERGMFNITKYKSFVNEEEQNREGTSKILFANPMKMAAEGKTVGMKKGDELLDWSHIDEHGFPQLNTIIMKDTVMLGKVVIQQREEKQQDKAEIFAKQVAIEDIRNSSVTGDKSVKGVVDKIFTYKKDNGLIKTKIRLRNKMMPEIGDKLCSRHGQKGVCGIIYDAVDMPYNEDGVQPDIIVNPHAIPTRMTIGHLVECVLAKLGCKVGMTLDATSYLRQDNQEICDLGTKYGLHRYGNEVLYNPRTGEQLAADIFFGPTYYYRLKHIVSDKINYRETGPKTASTRQPTQGRANDGGLRIGEMEVNSLLSHGISGYIRESMMEKSDKTRVYIDKVTRDFTTPSITENPIVPADIPYSLMQVKKILETTGMKMELYTDEDEEEAYKRFIAGLNNEIDADDFSDEGEK
jgi:DNA-directed RNA polymerase II subunit RPB2